MSLRLAVIFLTRVPVRLGPGEPPPVARAVPWFGVVGLGIGGVAGVVYACGAELFPPVPSAALAVGVAIMLTGALHLDGLGDVFDGFPSGRDADHRLEIMRDSRLGTYGTAAIVVVLLIQVSSLASLGPGRGAVALIAAHGLARAAAMTCMCVAGPARSEGLGVGYLAELRRPTTLLGVAATAGLSLLIVGPAALLFLAVPVVPALVMLAWTHRAIGGISGDVLGAVEQLAETAVLLTAAAVAANWAELDAWW